VLETNRPRLKVSRAGIVLIKSFESFRPRAVQRDDGRWVIGYGHTASAREGLTVGEQDAELLLQYDLIPIGKALNEQVEPTLNQHQFDALASFAVSVGVDRFLASDVLKRLNEGHAGAAADALVGWPEALSPDAALRRRAAERALFVADPAAPVLLADLLAAPLPPPPVQTEAEPVAEPVGEAVAEPTPLTRAAAVASLLGEPHEAEAVEAVEALAPEPAEPDAEAAPESQPEPAPDAPRALPLPSVWTPHGQNRWTPSAPAATAAQFQRYSPYAAAMIGPLPGFPTAAPDAEPGAGTEVAPVAETTAEAPEVVEAPVEIDRAPVETSVEAPVEAPVAITPPLASAAVEPMVEVPVFTPVAPMFSPAPGPSPFPPLELTPAVEADFAEPARDVWAPEQREGADEADETVLFEEEPPLAVLRHEVEPDAPRRFDWIETGPYMIMGGLGLFSCAASAAAFRKAMTDQSPLDDFAVIAWVLALIGVICVGVSAWNLYVKAGKRD
jgi:lysozyme